MRRDVTEDIRARVDLVDLISTRVRLIKAGRSFKGLCPFHDEKTPSFNVNPERQIWHCFGCGEHGDCFTFVMKTEALTFPQALQRLAEKTGVTIPEDARSSAPARGEREALYEALSASARFFRQCLEKSSFAKEYLASRQIDAATAERFGIGFAPESWDALTSFLGREKVEFIPAAKAGLIGQRRDGGYYDRFRNRLMFPIWDSSERIVGFGGRDLGSKGPKYYNSPETPVFQKGQILYGLSQARKAISREGGALVVEGYLDVISAHRAGLDHAVASMGTAMGDGHVRVLKLVTEQAVLCFDSDGAGQKAALAGGQVLEGAGFDVRVAVLPQGEDPDSMVCSGRAADLRRAIDEAVPASEHRLQMLMKRYNLTESAERARMLAQASRLLANIGNTFERDRLIRRVAVYHPGFAGAPDLAESRIRAEVDRLAGRDSSGKPIPAGRAKAAAPAESREKTQRPKAVHQAESILLRCLLENNEFAPLISEQVPAEMFCSRTARDLAAEIYTMRELGEDPASLALREDGEDDRLSRAASALLMEGEGPPLTAEAVEGCINRLGRERDRWLLLKLRDRFNRGELRKGDPDYQRLLSLEQQKQR